MADPDVVAERPYLRYVSARLPTSRPSHVAMHGVLKPVEDPFWDEFYPPNGFNCYCSVMSVSEDLLERRRGNDDWRLNPKTVKLGDKWVPIESVSADEGFQINPGKAEDI